LKILSKLQGSTFCKSFAAKGPLSSVLANIPISVVLNEDAPLLGAAYQALGTVPAARRQQRQIFFELEPDRQG
jgi:glucokinase